MELSFMSLVSDGKVELSVKRFDKDGNNYGFWFSVWNEDVLATIWNYFSMAKMVSF